MNREMVVNWLHELYESTGATAFFQPPVIGIASARDAFWEEFKKIIGPFHWTPQEVLHEEYPEIPAASVIVWVLPVLPQTCCDNSLETERPSRSWARTRAYGEEANLNIRKQLAWLLTEAGHPTVVPVLIQSEQKFDMREAGLASRFSERHAAFVAGLGTFGLSGGLITEFGIAHRIGAVVTSLEIEPDSRPYGNDPFAWCTQCGECAERCPAGSIGATRAERDKEKCLRYAYGKLQVDTAHHYGFVNMTVGCGLCQAGVPCESHRPGKPPSKKGRE